MLKMICPKCAMESAPADRCPICEGDTTKARKAAWMATIGQLAKVGADSEKSA